MTSTPCVAFVTRWRLVAATVGVCLFTVSASAQVPQVVVEQIVAVNIQYLEGQYLNTSRQIDDQEWIVRRRAITVERTLLDRQLSQFTAVEQRQARNQIEGLMKARLAILQPQWNEKAAALRRQRDEHDRAVRDAVTVDARVALESQRKRLLLQQRLERGEIAPETFAAEDKRALDEIMALRGKYLAEGERYADRFDLELEQLMRQMAKPQAPPPQPPPPTPPQVVARTPAPARPAPQAKTVETETPSMAYARDVSEAGDMFWATLEAARKFQEGEFDDWQVNTVKTAIEPELQKLITKWRAAGRAAEFEKDYKQNAADRMAREEGQRQNQRHAAFVSWMNGTLIFAAVIFGIYILFLILRAMGRKPTAPQVPVSDVYGTAHFAPTELSVLDDACLTKGLFFGKSSAPELVRLPLDAPGAPVCSTPEHHTLIVARTRTGKGTRVIVPTLLRYGGSAFVIDPKGENAAVTARVRRDELGQDIYILNPWHELDQTYRSSGFATATYNPLDILDRNDPNVVAVAQALAGAICPAPPNAKDRFWQGSASNVLTAVFLWLAEHDGVRGETKTLGRARQIVSMTRADFTAKHLVPMAASEAFGGAISELAAPFIDLADETYSGVMSNLSESTKFLSDPQVKAATATSSFSMEDLAAKKTTVYVVIPTDRMDTQKTWLRLIIAAGMHTFKRPKQKRVAHHRTLFLIDEFAALGRLDDLPRDIATMGGFGVDFALVVQGLDQLKDHYGEAKGTILSNCAYKWFCDVNDLDSAKYLSDTLGKATVATVSKSASSSAGPGGGSNSESTTYSETGRFLLNPDEVLNLGKNVAIAIQPNGHAQYLRPVDYWNLQEAFGHLQKEHPSLYWEPPLTYDQNPYVDASPAEAKMAVEDARKILGVTDAADLNEVRMAYLKLLPKLLAKGQPDQGGAGVSVKELNEAKDVLLGLQ